LSSRIGQSSENKGNTVKCYRGKDNHVDAA
jgi:hypothetical protein